MSLVRLPSFYPILDTATLERLGCGVVDAAEAMLEGGARWLQFRHKGHFSRVALEHAEAVARLCRKAGAMLIIDDRPDVARLLDAGTHLGQDDLAPAGARRILGDRLILGYSTHNEAQLRAAADEPADYLALGPIFATGSKQNPDPVLGVGELRRLRPLSTKPLVAIGGITRENAVEVLVAGADSVAVIGDLYPDSAGTAAIRTRVEEWLKVTG